MAAVTHLDAVLLFEAEEPAVCRVEALVHGALGHVLQVGLDWGWAERDVRLQAATSGSSNGLTGL